jgi:hypothetical protein
MARTFVTTNNNADDGSTANMGSSGETAGSATQAREMVEGGSGGATIQPAIGTSATDIERGVVGFETDQGAPIPNDADWESGDYVVSINLTTARSGISWRATYIMARTSGGSFTTVASLTGQSTDLGTTGTKSMTVNLASNYTANTTDTLYALLVFGGQLSHGNTSVTITLGGVTDVVTPLVSAGGGISIPVAMRTYRNRRNRL